MRLLLLTMCAGCVFAQANRPAPRTDANSAAAHQQLLEKTKAGRIDVYFEGDSITRRWGATDYPQFLAHWKEQFFGWNAANFGWGADRVENILWRLQNGELDGVNPKIVVLQGGTNNIGNRPPADPDALAADIASGLQACVSVIRAKAPAATIVVTGVFPRYDNPAAAPVIDAVNTRLAALADGKQVRFVNINPRLTPDTLNADRLHLALTGYQVWADALKPIFTEILGPPAKEDLAPPATGDPSARR